MHRFGATMAAVEVRTADGIVFSLCFEEERLRFRESGIIGIHVYLINLNKNRISKNPKFFLNFE